MHEHDFAYTVEEKTLKSEHLKKIFTLEADLVKTWGPAQVRGGNCSRKGTESFCLPRVDSLLAK